MENTFIYRSLITLLVVISVVEVGYSQGSNAQTEAIAAKTLRTLGDIPIVLQDEIKGGVHQLAGKPWDATEGVKFQRLELGMLATDTSDNTTYRCTTTATDDASNVEGNWEKVFIVTAYDSTKDYAQEEIVLHSDNIFYKATQAISSGGDITSDADWTPLGNNTDNQQLGEDLNADGNYYITLTDEDATSVNRVATETVKSINGAVTKIVKSDGTQIILASVNYTLGAASANSGVTVTIKNIKTGASPVISIGGARIDGINEDTDLWRTNDYITIVSDGDAWYKIGEGSSHILDRAASTDGLTGTGEFENAVYFGDPNKNDSWRIVSYDETSSSGPDGNVKRLRVECRINETWTLMSSFVKKE